MSMKKVAVTETQFVEKLEKLAEIFTEASGLLEDIRVASLASKWNKIVNKKDLIYILGDITMETTKYYYQLDKLKGRKIVILGNHDLPKHVTELLKHVESVSGMVKYKRFALTHCPIHPNEVTFYMANIHAHIHHTNKLEECKVSNSYLDIGSFNVFTKHKYWNCDAKLLDFKPRTLEELKIIYHENY